MRLTDKQREVLSFIQTFIDEKKYGPSVREITTGVGMTSPGNIHRHLSILRNKGLIQWEDFRQRTITITKAAST